MSEALLTWNRVARYRRQLLSRYRVRTKRQALRFIEGLGFCYAFTSGPGELPGLFDVLATRSVDRMWSWAWQWKDELATDRRLFYGKVLRRKPTYISLDYLPAFYALSGNVGESDDHLQAYREGRLSRLAKEIYEYVHTHGPCSTWRLRKQFVPRGASGGGFHRALSDLQSYFLIAKVGENEQGSYCFIWDSFARWLPLIPQAADRITTGQAAATVLERYLRDVGAAPLEAIGPLFGWPSRVLAEARGLLAGRIVDAQIGTSQVLLHQDLHA